MCTANLMLQGSPLENYHPVQGGVETPLATFVLWKPEMSTALTGQYPQTQT